MKRCKLVLGQMWGGRDLKQEVNIPDNVYFYTTGNLGHGSIVGCNHYWTVVKTEEQKEWLKYLKKGNRWGWEFENVGEYTVITIRIVYEDKHNLPVKSKEDVLKDINFHKYVFVYYDHDFRCVNIRRIFEFNDTYSVNVGFITLRDFFSFDQMLSIQSNVMELRNMFPSHWDRAYSKYKILEGVEAEMIWNTAISKVISDKFNYNPEFVDANYNFDAEYDEWRAKHGNKSWSELMEDLLQINFSNLEETDNNIAIKDMQ